MSHDVEAAYASSEVAELITLNQAHYFGSMGTRGAWSVFAGREGGHQWPLADGVLSAQNTSTNDVNIAFEFKRPNEGVHGILTALGQSYAYLEKGYDASIRKIENGEEFAQNGITNKKVYCSWAENGITATCNELTYYRGNRYERK